MFRARLSSRLPWKSGSAFRISLRTADYKVAVARAAHIASWMLKVKAVDDPVSALVALWPKLQALAVEPVRDETDLVDRAAFQGIAFETQYWVRLTGQKPDEVVPGWDEHFVAFIRENSRETNERARSSTVAGRLEQKRALLAAQSIQVTPQPTSNATACDPRASAQPARSASPYRFSRCKMSDVLPLFLEDREREYGDRRADSDIEPVVRFVIELLSDPVMLDFNWINCCRSGRRFRPFRLRKVFRKKNVGSIFVGSMPRTTAGPVRSRTRLLSSSESAKRRSRVVTRADSMRSGNSRSTIGARTSLPRISSPIRWYNPPAAGRDAFQPTELFKFFSAPPFTGCDSIARA